MKMTLEDAITLAFSVHRGQKDKGGSPYILHPLRVMVAVGFDEDAQMVAVLHDVIEDTDVDEVKLQNAGCPKNVVEALLALTRVDGETYADYIERVAKNRLAVRVKVADLEDNMRPCRAPGRTQSMMKRYRAAHYRLTNLFTTSGNLPTMNQNG